MAYTIIPDTMIDAYSPITETMMGRYRDNIEATMQQVLVGPMSSTANTQGIIGISDLQWLSLVTVKIYIPYGVVGQSGTDLRLYTYIDTQTNSKVSTSTSNFRLTAGGQTDTYDVINNSPTNTVSVSEALFELSGCSFTGGTVEDFVFEVYITMTESSSFGTVDANLLWDTDNNTGLVWGVT